MKRTAFSLAFALVLGVSASAQFSLNGGTFFAKDAAVKTMFGDRPFAFGFGLGAAATKRTKPFGFNVAGLSLEANGNRFQMIGGTYGIEQQYGDVQNLKNVTFFRAGVGIGYYDYNFDDPNILGTARTTGRKFNSLASAEFGYIISKKLAVSAQYIATPKVGGVDFSGVRLTATISF